VALSGGYLVAKINIEVQNATMVYTTKIVTFGKYDVRPI